MSHSSTIICYADGGCVGSNPSNQTYGSYKIGEESIVRYSDLGPGTNNTAEHEIIYLLLLELKKRRILRAVIYSDSQLVVRQIEGRYAVRAPHLVQVAEESQRLLRASGHLLKHVPRREIVAVLGH